MADVKPFQCIRPTKKKAEHIAALPYDVYDRQEAKKEVQREPLSFLQIDRAEIQFEEDVDAYAQGVYERAAETLWDMAERGHLLCEQQACYYIYELTWRGRIQDGLVACVSIDDYLADIIKKHEKTRMEKEQDRMRHIDGCNAHTGPVFLAYRRNDLLRRIIEEAKQQEALYDFISQDGVRHRVFRISETERINRIREVFEEIEQIYIADGHHRAAAAVQVGLMRRKQVPQYTGEEEFNYFLGVLFAEEQLQILDYNWVVKGLNGYSTEGFLEKVCEIFNIVALEEESHYPQKKGEFTMFLEEKWYLCQIKAEDKSADCVKGLDASILQEKLLAPVLGILEPRTDERIDFVGGIRGLEELERRVRTDCKVAFAMYPVSIQELFAVADAGRLMPPKTTWFEPKLRSGLFIHQL